MEFSYINGISVSKLTLGTVALGMDYGNFQGQQKPVGEERQSILKAALDAGINTFDTARTYGDAEKLLGDFLHRQEAGRPATVVTKFKVTSSPLIYHEFRAQAYKSVKESLESLNLTQLPICLFHMDSSFDIREALRHLRLALTELKGDGLIKMGGISVDHPMEAKHCIDLKEIEAIQIPINVLDQRLIHNKLLSRLQASGKLVFARSVFLRGLLFQSPGTLTAGMQEAAPFLQKLGELADRAGMSPVQFAFSYLRDLEGITSIVFGAERASQIYDNTLLLEGPGIAPEIKEQAEHFFRNVPEKILTPRMWTV